LSLILEETKTGDQLTPL